MKLLLLVTFLFSLSRSYSQTGNIYSFLAKDSIRVTIDMPNDNFDPERKTIIVFYALPNGNTTEQTMGKKMKEGDDWHFDIQHISAQTRFIRQKLRENFVVIYLENNYKSWPAWKQHHPDFKQTIPHIIDSLTSLIAGKKKDIYLNGHSGGGSFIFGFLAAVDKIPSSVKRISFLDSDYGYDSTYYPKFKEWLITTKGASLNVFAYNDSVALLNGKTFVTPTGGTWYRSHLFLRDLQQDFSFTKIEDDSLIVYKNKKHNIQFFFKTNPERKIFHTVQVELNGFIHSILCGTPYDSRNYHYYSGRAYPDLIE